MVETLALEARKEQIPESESIALQNSFLPFFQQAEQMKEQALAINVTSVDQVEDIKRARQMRLTLKNIRVDCEKVRKGLKEESLRKGKAIDGMANVIKYLIAPMEEHLDEQEKFLERQEQKRIEELRRKRTEELVQYQVDGNNFPMLGAMPDEQWQLLLTGVKTQYETAVAAAKKAEEDRIKREKDEAAERERQRIEKEATDKENERLRKENAKQKQTIEKKTETLKEVKKEIKEVAKQAEAVPRARAYSCGILQLDGDDIPDTAKKGDLCIFLRDTPENRHVQAHLMRP